MRIILFFLMAAAAWGQAGDENYESVATPPLVSVYGSAYNSCTMNATGERAGVVMILPKAGSITHIIFGTGTVPTPQTLKAGIYTVDSSATPTDTAYGSMVAGTQGTPAANSVYRVALSTPATAAFGDMVAVMIDFDSTAGDVRILHFASSLGSRYTDSGSLPRGKCYTGSWATTYGPGVVAVEYSDGTVWFGSPGYPMMNSTGSYTSINSGTANPHRGIRFIQRNAPVRVTHACMKTGTFAAGSSAIVRLADANRTTLASTPAIPDEWTAVDFAFCIPLDNKVTLSVGQTYYLFFIPQSADDVQFYRTTRIAGWAAYAPTYNDIVEITGDQSTGFTEASGYSWILWLTGERVNVGGGFSVAQ